MKAATPKGKVWVLIQDDDDGSRVTVYAHHEKEAAVSAMEELGGLLIERDVLEWPKEPTSAAGAPSPGP